MQTTPHKGISRDDVKFFLLILTIVLGAVAPSIATRIQTQANTTDITNIRENRKDSWSGQLTINERLQIQIADMDKRLVEIRTRVDYIEK